MGKSGKQLSCIIVAKIKMDIDVCSSQPVITLMASLLSDQDGDQWQGHERCVLGMKGDKISLECLS